MAFSNVAQSRTSLSIWPWNALWCSAKSISLITWGQSYKSKLLSDLSLISEVMFFDGTKDSKSSRRTTGLLKQGMKGLNKECTQVKQATQRQTACEIAYLWNLKNDADELIYKTEIDSQT